jgi:FSR family fosmidomycin resistance protein-like MFS transporter
MSQPSATATGTATGTPMPAAPPGQAGAATFAVLLSLSLCHLLNDMVQSLMPALYPLLKENYALDFGQVGLITLAFQCTASLLQPLVGVLSDRRPMPWSLPVGMGSSLVGLVVLSQASSFGVILLAAAMIGMGSAVFHPEASRVARLASGGRYGFAQSLFQVGGNIGSAVGPLLAAFIIAPRGQASILWFSAATLLAMAVLVQVGRWYSRNRLGAGAARKRAGPAAGVAKLAGWRIALAVGVLVMLVFSKTVYSASLTSYYTFYLIEHFGISVQAAQIYLFIFLVSIVCGTLAGGAVGDRVGRIPVIWFSILGALPFTLALPHAGLAMTVLLTIAAGLIMSSAFSAILVYAFDLVPGRVGLVSGVFFGFSLGLGGLGAAALGELADHLGIEAVYRLCAFLPLLGVLTVFLPKLEAPPADRPIAAR